MSVQKITLKNYKSFEQEQVFEIKPITLVIGKIEGILKIEQLRR